jgi:hypothetical protein
MKDIERLDAIIAAHLEKRATLVVIVPVGAGKGREGEKRAMYLGYV